MKGLKCRRITLSKAEIPLGALLAGKETALWLVEKTVNQSEILDTTEGHMIIIKANMQVIQNGLFL